MSKTKPAAKTIRQSTPAHFSFRPGKRQIIVLVVFVIALYAVVPQIKGFKHSFSVLGMAKPLDVILAIASTALAYGVGALTYCLLATRKLSYGRTLLVQVGGTFVNRLLPAGIGGIGVNFAYLRKSGQTSAEAGSIVAVNNLLGILGHFLLVTILLAVFHQSTPAGGFGGHSSHLLMLGLLALASVLLIVSIIFRSKVLRQLVQIYHQLRFYARHPIRLVTALLSSMTLTFFTVLSLWFCAQALGIHMSFVVVLIVFTFGLALGTATPTPGGLGGFEAGLIVGFVAYHVSNTTALAAVLAYRLISYWLALLIGAGAFFVVQRRHYL